MTATSKSRYFLLLVMTFFFWGGVYVAGKFISNDVPAPLLACLRCTVAVGPLLFMARKHLGTKIAREDRMAFLLVGGLGYFLTIFLIQTAITLTGAGMAALLNSLTPVAVTIIAAVLLKEKITPVKCLCLALALAGTVVITNGAGGEGQVLGIVLALVSVLCWGVASVFMRRLTAKYPPILVTAYGIAISLVFHLPVGIFTAATQPVTITGKTVLVVLYLGLIGSGLSQFTWTKCLSVFPASTCSLFYPLQAVFAAILGALILGESFQSTFLLGLLLISADVALSTWETRRQSLQAK